MVGYAFRNHEAAKSQAPIKVYHHGHGGEDLCAIRYIDALRMMREIGKDDQNLIDCSSYLDFEARDADKAIVVFAEKADRFHANHAFQQRPLDMRVAVHAYAVAQGNDYLSPELLDDRRIAVAQQIFIHCAFTPSGSIIELLASVTEGSLPKAARMLNAYDSQSRTMGWVISGLRERHSKTYQTMSPYLNDALRDLPAPPSEKLSCSDHM